MAIRSLTFPEFLEQCEVSIRLRNCVSRWIHEGRFPFATVGDYLDAGEAGTAQLLAIPNLGKKTIRQLNGAIAEALTLGSFGEPNENRPDNSNRKAIRLLSFPELLDRCNASVRLRNAITRGINEGIFTYHSVGDYIDGGKKAITQLLNIPNQ